MKYHENCPPRNEELVAPWSGIFKAWRDQVDLLRSAVCAAFTLDANEPVVMRPRMNASTWVLNKVKLRILHTSVEISPGNLQECIEPFTHSGIVTCNI